MLCAKGMLSRWPVGGLSVPAPAAASNRARTYALCCGGRRPEPSQCPCSPLVPGGGRRIVPPADCRPGPIPLNPCCPNFYHGSDHSKTYKYLFFILMLPLMITQILRVWGHESPSKEPCRHFEYMRIRTKRFPWGDGDKSLFHNDRVNSLPSECEIPPYPCPDYDFAPK